jgi:hypothetical protein
MKHYGIWCIEVGGWMMDRNGMIFWTTSKAVAEAQLELSHEASVPKIFSPQGPLHAEVREFEDE